MLVGHADGLDYVGGSVVVSIPVGESEACATFNIIDDGIFEGPESFGVALTSSDLTVNPQSSSAEVIISDNGRKFLCKLNVAQSFRS